MKTNSSCGGAYNKLKRKIQKSNPILISPRYIKTFINHLKSFKIMRKNNTLADLLPADTKKQLNDMKKNYKPIPKLAPKKKKSFKNHLANFELNRDERDHLIKKEKEVKNRPNDVLVKHYKTENKRLADKVSELTIVIVRAVEDLNHLIEAREIEKSIIKEMKEGIYSRWKQL
jgi:hypothetical protein